MKRRTKPFPSPQSQLRTYQRNQTPSVDSPNHFRAFTIGASNPKLEYPQIAMVGLSALLESARPDGPWMTIPHKGPGLKNKIFDIIKPHLGPKPILFGVSGWTTTTLVLIFSDLSVLLTQRTKHGLRIYPAVLYLRTRDHRWTSRIMLGRGKAAAAKLRITYIPYGAEHPKSREDREHHLYDEDILICPPQKQAPPENKTKSWHHWGQLLRQDVDLFSNAFEQLEGHALWPGVSTQHLNPYRLQRPSDWLHTFPKPPASHLSPQKKQNTFQNLSEWLLAMQTTLNTTPKDILVRQKQNQKGMLDILFLPPGQNPLQHGYGEQPSSYKISLLLNEPIMGEILPKTLIEPLREICQTNPGLRYRKDLSQAWAGDWNISVGHAEGPRNSHQCLKIFKGTEAPTSENMEFWRQTLQGLLP